MFIELFDESKDVYERIDSFKQKSNSLLERYGNGAGQHYQYENAICTYLWLRYPDKYYIYKLSEIKAVSRLMQVYNQPATTCRLMVQMHPYLSTY